MADEPTQTDASAYGTETLSEDRSRVRALEAEPLRGSSVGRYLVVERLGAGGMGVVYVAFDPELGRRVALKLLHARYRSEAAQARLLREAQALARVTHPRVVTVHDVGIHDERVFLAMEYVEGRTLRAFMADPEQGLAQRLAVLIAAGEGLAAAHRAGLVHRDFKPDNVMISHAGEVKVMDFGLARASEPDGLSSAEDLDGVVLDPTGPSSRLSGSSLLTEAGAVMGTPAYMAPELFEGQAADARSDQFAFCVTAYEAVFGVRPFTGENFSALVLAAAEGRIVEPKRRAPAWIGRAIRRGLAADPEQRWPDLDSLLAALRDDPILARRRRWIMGGALGFAAAAGALLTWWLARPDAEPSACALPGGLDGRWTASAREQVATALGDDPSSRSALALLDDYAARWDAAALDNCTSTRIEQRQSERVEHLRASCLRHRRAAFEQTLAGLRDDPSARERAVEAAGRLPELASCSDAAALELDPPLPEDPQVRERIEALRDELAGLSASLELRRSKTALERARGLLREAEALSYPPLEAEAALELGRALVLADALEAGVAELRRAYFVAITSGHARIQARAAIELVYSVGYLQQNHALGREWAEHGLAIVARVEQGGLLEADMLHVLGVLREAAGDHPGALLVYTRAYALRRAALPERHPDLARSLQALGNANLSLGELDAARDYHERALAMRRELFGPRHLVLTGSLNNLALVLGEQGELDAAKRALEQAVELLEQAGTAHADGLPRALTNLADVERRLGQLDRARELELRSLALRRASVGDEHPEVADSLVSLAQIDRDRGELDEAEASARDALARLERDFAAGHPEIFSATLVLASILEAKGELDRGAQLLELALAQSRTEALFADDRREAEALLERASAG